MKDSVFFDIDTQREFMHKRGRMYVPDAEDIVPNLEKLTKFAKKNKIRIIASIDDLRKREDKKPSASISYTKEKAKKKIKQTMKLRFLFVPNKKLNPAKWSKFADKNVLIEKDQYSIFCNPNTKKLLKDAKKAYVYGVATDLCVKETAIDLIKNKIETFIVKDAIKPSSKESGKKYINLLKSKGAKFLTTRQLLRRKRL